MTSRNLLTEYNELVARAKELDPSIDAKQLKEWKGKKEALQGKIDSLRDLVAFIDPKPRKKADKPTDTPADKPADVVTVADLAREIDRNPKVVRALLRRLVAKKDDRLPPMIDGTWTFAAKDRARVLAIINPSAE